MEGSKQQAGVLRWISCEPRLLLPLYLHTACIIRLETIIWMKCCSSSKEHLGASTLLWMLELLGMRIDELARGLFYTPAEQHWQLVLATSCMAASRF